MKGDFSRSSFDPQKHYTSVRMQQGRVQLDADWNEQADITLHQLRTQLEDLIGNAGIPQSPLDFMISDVTENKDSKGGQSELDFTISAGRCYVDGILCDNQQNCKYTNQPNYDPGAIQGFAAIDGKVYLAYLDVWERHVTALEDPDISEVALEGTDTATRTKTVWQVKLEPVKTEKKSFEDQSQRQAFIDKKRQEYSDTRKHQKGIDQQYHDFIVKQRQEFINHKHQEYSDKESQAYIDKELRDYIDTEQPKLNEKEQQQLITKVWQEFITMEWQEEIKKDWQAYIESQWQKLIEGEWQRSIDEEWQRSIDEEWQRSIDEEWLEFVKLRTNKGQLTAYYDPNAIIQQNQLYRVEIHHSDETRTTFKWSRENGSIAYPIIPIDPPSGHNSPYKIHLKLVDSDKLYLEKEDLAELTDDDDARRGTTRPLFEVIEVQKDTGIVTLKSKTSDVPKAQEVTRTLLRRWDHRSGNGQNLYEGAIVLPSNEQSKFTIQVSFVNELDAGKADPSTNLRNQFETEGVKLTSKAHIKLQTSGKSWMLIDGDRTYRIQLENGILAVTGIQQISLENGISISFSGDKNFVVGDYWLIPARVNYNDGSGGILWPADQAQLPHGIQHHYAPLAVIQCTGGNWQLTEWKNLRFRTLPVLTAEVDENLHRIKKAEDDIKDLKIRVAKLEEQMAEVLKRARTSLYQYFKSTDQLKKGDVVAMDPNPQTPNQIQKVNSDNETLVLGIVDEVIEDYYVNRVILQGIAQCRVVGAVKAGQLLVPSAGGLAKAAKLYVQPGTVIGKALASHDTGDAEAEKMIEILITLS